MRSFNQNQFVLEKTVIGDRIYKGKDWLAGDRVEREIGFPATTWIDSSASWKKAEDNTSSLLSADS